MNTRILHVISSSGFYGAEAATLNLLSGLRELGCEVMLATLVNRGNPHAEIAEAARQAGFPVTTIPCRSGLDVSAVLVLRSLARHAHSQIVHSHGYKADCYSLIACSGLSARLVATCHNWTDQTRALRVYGWLDRRFLRRFDALSAVSPDVAARLERDRVSRHKIREIRNGVATPAQTEPPPRKRQAGSGRGVVIGFVGRLVKEKGVFDLVNAAQQILLNAPDTHFVMAGEGPGRNDLTKTIHSLGIGSHFELLGFQADMNDFYRNVDIVVLPSLLEGMPMSILEAMAHAKPVVASRVGAIPQMIDDGVTGLLITPGDIQCLTQTLLSLIVDPDLRSSMGARSRERIRQRFSVQAMAGAYLDMYGAALVGKAMKPLPPYRSVSA